MNRAQTAILPAVIITGVLLYLLSTFIGHPTTVSASSIVLESLPAPTAPGKSGCSLPHTYPETIQLWCGLIEKYAAENRVDAAILAAVMLQESKGNPLAYSSSGAVGLMQIMPRDGLAAKFMCINGPCFADRPSMKELFDPDFNIAYGARMLSGLVQRYGSIREALKAYGPRDMGYHYADLILDIHQSHN